MAGLYLYRSNRLEALGEALASIVQQSPAPIFTPEMIVVQSPGMGRWLSFALGRRLGVAMNCRFPFPAHFAEAAFRAAFPDEKASGAFSRDALPWRIRALLPELLEREDAALLRRYVSGTAGELKEHQLCLQIGAMFDRYLVHRHGALLKWQNGDGDDWQAELWRLLAAAAPEQNPPRLLQRLVAAMERGECALDPLPQRISVFGISALPAFHLDLLAAIARQRDVHLFLLEPTPEWWGDDLTPREAERLRRRGEAAGQRAEELHLLSGNALVTSLGRAGRAFARGVVDLSPTEEAPLFEEPEGDSLLQRVQQDLYVLQTRTGGERDLIAAGDRSLQVHCCHSPLREVEVLYDGLLDLFERIPGLTPKDILVAAPDVEVYAPFVEAVFGCPEAPDLAIPYSLADRTSRAANPIARALLLLLDLDGSRLTPTAVLGLLEAEPVRRRFALSDQALAQMRQWIAEARIRWSYDPEHRAAFALPPYPGNTWREGWDRLLLGYALPGDGEQLFAGILPLPGVEGNAAAALGAGVDFIEKLQQTLQGFQQQRTLRGWARFFRSLLNLFFDESAESAVEMRRLHGLLSSFAALHEHFPEKISFAVARAHLTGMLTEAENSGGFLAGHVSVCSMKPMRSIPFRVIWLLGMNDDAFPRRDRNLSFDLLAQDRLRGVHGRRDEDRQLFLDTILSARDVLCLSYCGLSQQNKTEKPPSVVVSELLDYCEGNFEMKERSVREELVVHHQLQAFSPSYFSGDDRLFSYSRENSRAGEDRRLPRKPRTRWLETPLPWPAGAARELTFKELTDFLCYPAKTFIRKRLMLQLPHEGAVLEDREPMELNALERMLLRQRLLEQVLAGVDFPQAEALARAEGRLPATWRGDQELAGAFREADGLKRRMGDFAEEPARPPRFCTIRAGDWMLSGTISGARDAALLRYRAATLKARDLLRGWVAHLALLAAEDEDLPRETRLFAVESTAIFREEAEPAALLAQLADLYAAGLCAPLRLFPETSRAYAEAIWGPTPDPEKAREAAMKKWMGGGWNGGPGEIEDAHVRLCFGEEGEGALNEEWRNVCEAVYRPLFQALKVEKVERA